MTDPATVQIRERQSHTFDHPDLRARSLKIAGTEVATARKEARIRLDFTREGTATVTATHHVGLFPYSHATDQEGERRAHGVMVVLPKGVDPDDPGPGLLRFAELMSFASGSRMVFDNRELELEGEQWRSVRGVEGKFTLLLALHYHALLLHLCRHDFRRNYRDASDVLVGRVRGRLNLHRHTSNVLKGRAHHHPCAWEEFTADNWDNRILKSAFVELGRTTHRLAPGAGRAVTQLFSGRIATAFEEVQVEPGHPPDLHRKTLHRLSPSYARALGWAELLLRGMGTWEGGDGAHGIAIDANRVFEDFAVAIASRAAWQHGMTCTPQKKLDRLLADGPGDKVKPDIVLETSTGTVVAIGDAKYKKLLEHSLEPTTLDEAVALRLKSADLYQMYAYMRMTGCRVGFFVVPFWDANADRPAASLHPGAKGYHFKKSPVEDEARLYVIGVNLMKPARESLELAAGLLGPLLAGG